MVQGGRVFVCTKKNSLPWIFFLNKCFKFSYTFSVFLHFVCNIRALCFHWCSKLSGGFVTLIIVPKQKSKGNRVIINALQFRIWINFFRISIIIIIYYGIVYVNLPYKIIQCSQKSWQRQKKLCLCIKFLALLKFSTERPCNPKVNLFFLNFIIIVVNSFYFII